MRIRCYNFHKKHNDTVRPSGSAVAIEFNIDLKRPTSINNPIFLLDIGDSMFNYNYIYWVEMNAYYFVEDVIYGNNYIKEIVCSCDVLATARQYIINQSAFVKYSSLNYDAYIRDDRIQPTSQITTSVSNNSFASDISIPDDSNYCYLLTSICEDGVISYILDGSRMEQIGDRLINNAEDIIGQLKEFFGDVKESVIKLQIIPWSIDALKRNGIVPQNQGPVKLGGYVTTVTAYIVDETAIYHVDDFVDIPSRPNDFTRIEPYCEAKIHIPLLGVHDLSLSELQDVNRIYFRYVANILTGAATCILFKGNSDIDKAQLIGSYEGNVNYEIPLGYISSANPIGALSGTASGVAAIGAAIGGASAAVVAGGIAASVASFGSYMQKSVSMMSAFSGNASAYDSKKLSVILYKHGLTETPDNLRQLYGRPCGKVLALNTLIGGYVQTSEFELQAGFDNEMTQQVNRLMDSGVYLN